MKRNVLLTPGPLTTSTSVKEAMMIDLGTRDQDFQNLIQGIRKDLLQLVDANACEYTCILLQGSGTYGVESVLTSTISTNQKVLILANGSYGNRMEEICIKAKISYEKAEYSMIEALPIEAIEKVIQNSDATHVAYIHCETTAGVLNDIDEIQRLIHKYQKISIVDAMSSFASLALSIDKLGIDYLIASSNKCLHGVPGIAIVFARKALLEQCKNICPSLSLDLYEQYKFMEQTPGSFRFTSPTHVLLALSQAIQELKEFGGIDQRHKRYLHVQKEFHSAMSNYGFETLIDQKVQSPVITTYRIPDGFDFSAFYEYFKRNGILLYSGKLPTINAFRIGNIGQITDEDIEKFKMLLAKYLEVKTCK